MNNADMPAMPLTEDQIDRSERGNGYEGLTKREYFAAVAAQGIVANQEWMENAMSSSGLSGSECVAKGAVCIADAMLDELERKQ